MHHTMRYSYISREKYLILSNKEDCVKEKTYGFPRYYSAIVPLHLRQLHIKFPFWFKCSLFVNNVCWYTWERKNRESKPLWPLCMTLLNFILWITSISFSKSQFANDHVFSKPAHHAKQSSWRFNYLIIDTSEPSYVPLSWDGKLLLKNNMWSSR